MTVSKDSLVRIKSGTLAKYQGRVRHIAHVSELGRICTIEIESSDHHNGLMAREKDNNVSVIFE